MRGDVFRAVADPTRRAILVRLKDADRTVHDLNPAFRMTQPAISKHLRVLRQAGLVRRRRVGRESFYRLTPKPLHAVYDWVSDFRRLADPSGHVWRIRKESPHGHPGPQAR